MSGNAQKLCLILALSVLLLGVPRVPLHTYAVHAASTVYDVVSPGTLSPGIPVPPPTEPVVLTVRGRFGLAHAEAGVTFDIPTLEHLGLIRFTTPTAWTDGLVTFEGVLLSRLSTTPAALRPAPCLGQRHAYVYGELLGMSAADMARYTAEGIFY